MMNVKVRAGLVGEIEDPEEGNYTIVVAEDDQGVGEHVEFQGSDEFDEQDVRLGMDTYCMVVHPWNACAYGGVLWWGLRDRVLEVRLDDTTSATLEVDGGIRLDLHDLSADEVEKLEKGVARVLADVPRDDALIAGCLGTAGT
jgi:hypothetical protein